VPGCRSTKDLCQTLEIPGADKQKGLLSRWWVTLQKQYYICDGQLFFIDRGLLMGALVLKSAGSFFVWMSTCNMQFEKIAGMCPIMDSDFILLHHHR